MLQVYKLHHRDPNFPQTILERIEEFLRKPPSMLPPPCHPLGKKFSR